MSKYYLCNVCGNLVEKIEDGGNNPSCCNRTMTNLQPASTDGAIEKHVPVITQTKHDDCLKRVTIKIGEVQHPSDAIHYIQWIELETKGGVYRRMLKPGDCPCVNFYVPNDDDLVGAYCYCNLHGLWFGR